MPDLFGIDIAGIVASSIASAGGLLPATLTKRTPGTRDPNDRTAGTNPTSIDYACEGVIADYATNQIDGTLIARGDRQVMLLGALLGAVVPAPNDRVTIEGTTYDVIRVTRDPAAATYTLQVRGAP